MGIKESELIKFVDVNFNGADGTGTFNDDTDFTAFTGSPESLIG